MFGLWFVACLPSVEYAQLVNWNCVSWASPIFCKNQAFHNRRNIGCVRRSSVICCLAAASHLVHYNLWKTCTAAEARVPLYTCVRHKHHTLKTCIFQGRLRCPLLTEGTQLSESSEVINTLELRVNVPHVWSWAQHIRDTACNGCPKKKMKVLFLRTIR